VLDFMDCVARVTGEPVLHDLGGGTHAVAGAGEGRAPGDGGAADDGGAPDEGGAAADHGAPGDGGTAGEAGPATGSSR
jgi:hypothetical protein